MKKWIEHKHKTGHDALHACFPTMSLGVSFSDDLKCKTGFHAVISIFHVCSHQHWAGKNACVVLMLAWGGVLKIVVFSISIGDRHKSIHPS